MRIKKMEPAKPVTYTKLMLTTFWLRTKGLRKATSIGPIVLHTHSVVYPIHLGNS